MAEKERDRISFEISPAFRTHINRVLRTGLFGRSDGDVAHRLTAEKLSELLRSGQIDDLEGQAAKARESEHLIGEGRAPEGGDNG